MTTFQETVSAASTSSGSRPQSLRHKLLWSHLAIAAIGLSMLLVALWLFLWLRRDALRLADVRGPTARNSALALGGVHHSLASLRGWVLLGDPDFKVQRAQAWRDEIRPSLETLKRLSGRWTNASDKQRLAEATSLLNQLDDTQTEIERIAQTPENEPARVLLDGHIEPTVERVFDEVTGMIELEKQQPSGSQRKSLLATMADFRGTFSRSTTFLEAYLGSADPAHEAGFQKYLQDAHMSLREMSAKPESLTEAQYAHLLVIQRHLQAYESYAREAIDIRKSNGWNTALDLLAREAFPKSRAARLLLEEMSLHQEKEMAADGLRVKKISNRAVMLTLAMLGITAVATWFISQHRAKKITEPIAVLSQATADLAARRTSAALPVTSRDELGRLTESFNSMRIALQVSEHAVRASEKRMRTAIEAAPNGMVVVNRNAEIVLVNSETELMFGYTRDEMIGRPVELLVPERVREKHVADRDAFLQDPEARPMSERSDLTGRRKDGSEFPVEVGLNPMETDDGLGVVASVVDITERKRAAELLEQKARELALANEQLVRSNADLDDFAYIASHDLKEPLRGISNYAGFLLEDYGEKLEQDGLEKLQTLQRLCARLEDLINSLLHYSRVGRAELAVQETDLNEVVDGVLDALHITIEDEQVSIDVPEPLPTVVCDATRVRELYNNLITNAIKYNDKPEKLVEIGYREEAAEEPASKGHLVFYVKDNGIGIREKDLTAVFRIFKRLHRRNAYGGGTGAGLAFVKQIVERHGGRIWVESEYGEGSTFYFTLNGNL